MRPSRALLAAVLVGSVAFTASSVGAADDPTAVLTKRQAHMKQFGASMKAISQILESGSGDLAAIQGHAETLRAGAKDVPALFPTGTGMEDKIGKSAARKEIWSDWQKFNDAAKSLETESAKLIQVALTGDKAATAAQYSAVGKNGCGGCHTSFRAKLD